MLWKSILKSHPSHPATIPGQTPVCQQSQQIHRGCCHHSCPCCCPSQRVRVILNTSPVISDSPQGCVPSPLLYSLYTYDYASTHPNNTIIKFADYMTLDGLISSQDESVYRDEVKQLFMWCKDNNLALNISNTKELVKDFRMNRTIFPCSS